MSFHQRQRIRVIVREIACVVGRRKGHRECQRVVRLAGHDGRQRIFFDKVIPEVAGLSCGPHPSRLTG